MMDYGWVGWGHELSPRRDLRLILQLRWGMEMLDMTLGYVIACFLCTTYRFIVLYVAHIGMGWRDGMERWDRDGMAMRSTNGRVQPHHQL